MQIESDLRPGHPLLILGAAPTPTLSILHSAEGDDLWIWIYTPGRGWGMSLVGRDAVVAH